MLYFLLAFVLLFWLAPSDYYAYLAVLVYFALLLVYLIDVFTYLNREEDDEFVRYNFLKAEEMIKKSGRTRSIALPVSKCVLAAIVILRLCILCVYRFHGLAAYAGSAVAVVVIGLLLYLDISGKGFWLSGLTGKKRYASRQALIFACLTAYILCAAYLSPLLAGIH